MRDRPSSTARIIAAATVLLAGDRATSHLIDTEAARICRAMLSRTWSDRRLLETVSSSLGQRVWHAVERIVQPGILRHFALRKEWIERHWRAAHAEGFTQLIVLAAGLDTLAVRVANTDPDVRVIEVDHPASQRAKLAALNRERGVDRVRFVPAELGEPGIGERLVQDGVVDRARSTFVVIEGLMMYLLRERVLGLLREMAQLDVPRVQVAWTFIETTELRTRWYAGGGQLMKWWLTLTGEPFKSTLRADEIEPALQECGLELSEMENPGELAGGGTSRSHSRGPVGDWVVLAQSPRRSADPRN